MEFEERIAGGGDDQERVLPQDRVVSLEHVEVKRVPLAPFNVRVIVDRRVAVAVTIPRREADAPAILDGDEMVVRLHIAREDAGATGIAERSVNAGLVESRQPFDPPAQWAWLGRQWRRQWRRQ